MNDTTTAPELTVADMMARIREQLTERQDGHILDAAHPFDGAPCVSDGRRSRAGDERAKEFVASRYRGFKPSVDWHQFVRGLRTAEQYAAISNYLPELPRLPTPMRRLVRGVARGLLLLARFVVNRQNAFNHATLGVVCNIQGVLQHFEKVEKDNVKRLEEVLAEQSKLIQELNARVCSLEKQLGQVRSGQGAPEYPMRLLLEVHGPGHVEVLSASGLEVDGAVGWKA